MKLRTDDEIYRARLVYLGPPGYTLPFQLPYAQYGLFAVLATVVTTAVVVLTGSWAWSGFALASAALMTSYIWQYVDHDRPARAVIRVALTDWRSITAPKSNLPRLTAGHIRFSDLETGDNR